MFACGALHVKSHSIKFFSNTGEGRQLSEVVTLVCGKFKIASVCCGLVSHSCRVKSGCIHSSAASLLITGMSRLFVNGPYVSLEAASILELCIDSLCVNFRAVLFYSFRCVVWCCEQELPTLVALPGSKLLCVALIGSLSCLHSLVNPVKDLGWSHHVQYSVYRLQQLYMYRSSSSAKHNS